MNTTKHALSAVMALLVVAGCSSDDAETITTSAAVETAASVETAPSVAPAAPVETAAPIETTAPIETAAPVATAAPVDTAPATSGSTSGSVSGAETAGPRSVQELLDLGRPIVLAHAAGEDEHPHSTPYGYAESVAAGVDMLDFDVQLTADGQLVVQHDEDTGRTTNEDLVVAETDFADLALLDNAYWFTADCTCTGQPDEAYVLRGMRTGDVPPLAGYSPADFAIPLFSDIIDRFPDLPVNIEIKGSGAQAVAAAYELARILTDEDRLDSAVVTSFDDTVVAAFHELAPDVEVTPGLGLSSDWILSGKPLPDGMRILQLPPEFQGIEVLTRESIEASHAAGYVIWVWPNDRKWENPEGYATLLQMGLDGLNINFPADGVQALDDFLG